MRKQLSCHAIALVLLTACGGKSGGGGDPSQTIPNGTYTVTGPFCNTTGASPRYKTLEAMVSLRDFHGLTTHTITIKGGEATEVFARADCTLNLVHKMGTNANDQLAFRLSRTHTWTPEDCVLPFHLEREGVTYDNYDKATAFADVKDDSYELLFDVSKTKDGGFTLLTPNQAPINKTWGEDSNYGCATPDRIKFVWKLK